MRRKRAAALAFALTAPVVVAASIAACVGDEVAPLTASDGGNTPAPSASGAVPLKVNGLTCGAAAECQTNECIDGVCCASKCEGSCQKCNLVGTTGTCAAIPGCTSTTDDSGGGGDSGGTTGDSGGPTDASADADAESDGSDAGTGDGGVDCSALPKLHDTTAGFFCPFLIRDASADTGTGGPDNCANNEICCDNGRVPNTTTFGVSFCAHVPLTKNNNGDPICSGEAATYGATWYDAGATTWECASAANCGASQRCCAYGEGGDAGPMKVALDTRATAAPPACNPQYINRIGGSKCASTCAVGAGEIELCSVNDTCSNTKGCIAASAFGGHDLGVCPP